MLLRPHVLIDKGSLSHVRLVADQLDCGCAGIKEAIQAGLTGADDLDKPAAFPRLTEARLSQLPCCADGP